MQIAESRSGLERLPVPNLSVHLDGLEIAVPEQLRQHLHADPGLERRLSERVTQAVGGIDPTPADDGAQAARGVGGPDPGWKDELARAGLTSEYFDGLRREVDRLDLPRALRRLVDNQGAGLGLEVHRFPLQHPGLARPASGRCDEPDQRRGLPPGARREIVHQSCQRVGVDVARHSRSARELRLARQLRNPSPVVAPCQDGQGARDGLPGGRDRILGGQVPGQTLERVGLQGLERGHAGRSRPYFQIRLPPVAGLFAKISGDGLGDSTGRRRDRPRTDQSGESTVGRLAIGSQVMPNPGDLTAEKWLSAGDVLPTVDGAAFPPALTVPLELRTIEGS